MTSGREALGCCCRAILDTFRDTAGWLRETGALTRWPYGP
ncbi:hypothetical protein FHU38_003511 [Saccharomonospora amisosensis]|uniref:Uncharacterized protein n=1 Tax=Saccharomonospora amisosensis TaxID=1128677 RepID=A0A7X5ZRT0_9PSEU|nr:hypothetical protein [Saccharomonospora amisosensis]